MRNDPIIPTREIMNATGVDSSFAFSFYSVFSGSLVALGDVNAAEGLLPFCSTLGLIFMNYTSLLIIIAKFCSLFPQGLEL